MSPSIDFTLDRIVAALRDVPGLVAIALGGSRARGWHRPDSDIDIGLYYRGAGTLDLAALNAAATALDDARRADLASPHGGWGVWMDGGAWLTVDGIATDLIYRDLDRVEVAIAEAETGRFQIAYHFGHPHGFVSAAYAGELALARPLHDPQSALSPLKARLDPYPEALRAALICRFQDEALFTLPLAMKAADRDDSVYYAASAWRVVACLCQILFALNRVWLINEKGAAARASTLPLAPRDFAARAAVCLRTEGARDLANLATEVCAFREPKTPSFDKGSPSRRVRRPSRGLDTRG